MLKLDSVDKKKLHKLLLEGLKEQIAAIRHAAGAAKDGATHEEAVAKSKYETHGLELSYLAGSQFERARIAETKLTLLENAPFTKFLEDDAIDTGALIGLRDHDKGLRHVYLLSSIGAGLTLRYEDEVIKVISPESPLGESLMSLGVGDIVGGKEVIEVR
ncbi:MAG: hypothetical protein EOP04_03415 [Proteobacteria bacterium]|nr:MAG: hypothetical protein EOP04_03415 [Pseudomonadota bacterium]